MTKKKSGQSSNDDIHINQMICGQVDKKELKAVPISDLIPYKNNANKGDVDKVAASLKEFGYVKNSVGIDENNILLYGHTTLKAAVKLGWDKIPEVTQIFGLSEIKKKAYRLMDNQAGRSAEWDLDLLVQELNELKMDNFNLDLTGFDGKEMAGFEREVNKGKEPQDTEPQISRAEELRKEWGTCLGQMWQCGEHWVICGDCTDLIIVKRLMGDEKADMVFTDPPYGIGYEYSGEYKDKGGEKYLSWCREWFDHLKKYTDLIIITTGWTYKSFWYSLNPYDELTWFDETKQSGGKSSHLRKSEPIFVFGKVKEKYAWDTLKNQGTRGDGLRELHTCPKPLSLISDIIEPQTTMASVVLDVFLGSGTTMIACENLGRKGRFCEIDPGYVAVALERFKTTFGIQPVLLQE